MFGKALLIFVAAISLGGIYLGYSINDNVLETDARLAKDEVELLARNASLAGLDNAKQDFWNSVYDNADGSFDQATVSGSVDGYKYDAAINSSPKGANYAILYSLGYGFTGRSDSVYYESQAEYHIYAAPGNDLDENGIPLQDAVNTACDVSVDGSSLIQSGTERNANIHTNGTISTGNNTHQDNKGVFGYGLIGIDPGTLTFNNQNHENRYYDYFQPYNPTDDESVLQADPITDQDFNALITNVRNVYRDNADMVIGMGPPTDEFGNEIDDGKTYEEEWDDINWNDVSGTVNNPYVIHHSGNLSLTGGTIPPYTIVIVDGDLTMSGNVTAGAGGPTDMSSTAWYVSGDLIKGNGTVEVWGQFFIEGNFDRGNGTFILHGNISAKCDGGGTLDLTGNFTIDYLAANPALTGVPPEYFIERVSHSEWSD